MREAAADGWVDPHPERTLTPEAQQKLAIRFGLVSPLSEKANARPAKKSAMLFTTLLLDGWK